ncbi:hypothetical protein B7P43_G14957 [Cryptotermes secundus]|uniref:Uncharacterized protein n=1 Tax=Cryptotermes secundus TaxID=105785 RepID=A0A2J7PDZ0_9NEOP|nr:hypothetical protein B7P43_G14957 [Cryptotermes secundus]
MQFNLNCLPNDAIHIVGLGGEDGGVLKLNAVYQIDAAFSYGRLVRLFETDVPLMLLQPHVHRAACLPNTDLSALAWDTVYSRCP